ncbi:cysteine desulfurase family protein [soil metagenome]
MHPAAVEAMLPFLTERFGNPSGAHALARDARRALDEARELIADLLGARPGEVVLTSGGTEADNLAVLGVAEATGGAPACTTVEHHAVLHAVTHRGGPVVAVDGRGLIDLDALAAALDQADPPVTVLSVTLANNEIGTVTPLAPVRAVLAEHAPGAVLHTDAVQAVYWLDLTEAAAPAELLSISAHKFGGPKGVGALVVRDGVRVAAQLFGGGQERERRSGTPPVAAVVAMATALAITVDDRKASVERLAPWRDRLVDGLVATVPGCRETAVVGGERGHKIAGNAHLCIEGIDSEALLFLLEREGVLASAASSCASGAMEPSHVLAAIGVDRDRARGSLRLSLGATTTARDIDLALAVIPPAVERLRRFDGP